MTLITATRLTRMTRWRTKGKYIKLGTRKENSSYSSQKPLNDEDNGDVTNPVTGICTEMRECAEKNEHKRLTNGATTKWVCTGTRAGNTQGDDPVAIHGGFSRHVFNTLLPQQLLQSGRVVMVGGVAVLAFYLANLFAVQTCPLYRTHWPHLT